MDKGTWHIFHNKNGVLKGIISSDSTHNVVLYVTGDFGEGQLLDYCLCLANKLNKTEIACEHVAIKGE